VRELDYASTFIAWFNSAMGARSGAAAIEVKDGAKFFKDSPNNSVRVRDTPSQRALVAEQNSVSVVSTQA
jgi:hypothetical protein